MGAVSRWGRRQDKRAATFPGSGAPGGDVCDHVSRRFLTTENGRAASFCPKSPKRTLREKTPWKKPPWKKPSCRKPPRSGHRTDDSPPTRPRRPRWRPMRTTDADNRRRNGRSTGLQSLTPRSACKGNPRASHAVLRQTHELHRLPPDRPLIVLTMSAFLLRSFPMQPSGHLSNAAAIVRQAPARCDDRSAKFFRVTPRVAGRPATVAATWGLLCRPTGFSAFAAALSAVGGPRRRLGRSFLPVPKLA